MDQSTTIRPRGTEEMWLDAAYRALTEQGVDAVKVMPLAKELGQSRTSFYWHFKDRDALLDALVGQWERKNTGNLVAQCEAYAENICEAMFNIFDCWLDEALFDARLDLAIRNWARTDPALTGRLNAADAARLAALKAMFLRFGYGDEAAEVRAMTIIYTQIGYFSMLVREPLAERLDRMPAYIEVFTGHWPAQSDIDRFRARHPLP